MNEEFLPGSYGGDPDRLRDTSRLECKFCWYVYDPAAGAALLPGTGIAQVEAALGRLVHCVRFRNGRILNYQIIASTAWNFLPRDSRDMPGTLEQALFGAPERHGMKDPVAVQHIVRSFDPCMVCAVH